MESNHRGAAHTEKFLHILFVVRSQALTYRTLVGLGGGGSLVIHRRKHDGGSFYRRNKFTQLCFQGSFKLEIIILPTLGPFTH